MSKNIRLFQGLYKYSRETHYFPALNTRKALLKHWVSAGVRLRTQIFKVNSLEQQINSKESRCMKKRDIKRWKGVAERNAVGSPLLIRRWVGEGEGVTQSLDHRGVKGAGATSGRRAVSRGVAGEWEVYSVAPRVTVSQLGFLEHMVFLSILIRYHKQSFTTQQLFPKSLLILRNLFLS